MMEHPDTPTQTNAGDTHRAPLDDLAALRAQFRRRVLAYGVVIAFLTVVAYFDIPELRVLTIAALLSVSVFFTLKVNALFGRLAAVKGVEVLPGPDGLLFRKKSRLLRVSLEVFYWALNILDIILIALIPLPYNDYLRLFTQILLLLLIAMVILRNIIFDESGRRGRRAL